jgi:hypothetical protein
MKQHVIKIFLLAVLVCCPFRISAQWKVGIGMGYTTNSVSTNESYFYDRHYETRGGIALSIPVQYNFKEWFALETEVTYVQKNHRVQRSGYYSPLYENNTNHYLSIPVYSHFSFGGEKLRGFLNAGFYAGYWLASHRKGKTFSVYGLGDSFGSDISELDELYEYDENLSFDSRRDNRFDAGALAGIGMEYSISKRLQVTAECRYYYSLTDMQKKYMRQHIPHYNNTFAFQIGLMIGL